MFAVDLSREVEDLNKKLSGERLKLQASEGKSKTLTAIVGELREALVAEQKKVAGLAQFLDDARANLDARNLQLAQRDEETSKLQATLKTEQFGHSEELANLGTQITQLESDIAAAEQKIKISTNQATALVGITNELRAALRSAQDTANTLRDNAAQFDRQLASALSIDTPDRQIILERISLLTENGSDTATNPESLRADFEGAVREVEMLSKQNANLKATIQTLLANSSKIIERLRSK
jgi:chromosome segregation ATPase